MTVPLRTCDWDASKAFSLLVLPHVHDRVIRAQHNRVVNEPLLVALFSNIRHWDTLKSPTFTRLTSAAWYSMVQLLWTTPIPPVS